MTQSGRRYGGRRAVSFSRRVAAVLVIAGFTFGLLPSWAGASELPEGEREGAVGFREETAWGDGNLGMALWFWPEGDRTYQLHADNFGYKTLRAYEDDGMTRVASVELVPQAWGAPATNPYSSAQGRHHLATVDRDQGRVFVAYQMGIEDAAVSGGRGWCGVVETAKTPVIAISPGPGCVGGIHVLDGSSLEPVGSGKIPLDLPTVEGPRVQPIPRAMAFAPAVPERGWGGRVLMIVEEIATGPVENSPAPSAQTQVQYTVPRRNGGNIAYAVAFDPESMRQEWAVRLEGCRNSREPRSWGLDYEGHPMAVFRAGGEEPALYVGCHGNSAQQGVVVRVPLDEDGFPAVLPVTVGDPARDVGPEAEASEVSGLVAPAPRQGVFPGPEKVTVVLADPESQRMLMRVDDKGEVWWVFDGHSNQFIGTIGIGPYNHGHTTYGVDPDIGRLYVLAAEPAEPGINVSGGLYVADIRRTPLAQALVFPQFAGKARSANGQSALAATTVGRTMSVRPRADGAETSIFETAEDPITKGPQIDGKSFYRLVDATAAFTGVEDSAEVRRSADIAEAPGVTAATFDGTARGFGFRTIMLGGVEGMARVGPADPVGVVRGVPQFEGQEYDPTGTRPYTGISGSTAAAELATSRLEPDPCTDAQRELVVAFVGPRGSAVVDASSARGEAQPVVADTRTQQDVGAPVTRCAPADWQKLWQTALVSQPPMSEPGVDWPFEDGTSSCTATDEDTADSWSDPVVGMFASRVECGENEVAGWGQARGINLDGLSVAHALSSFRIYRDPGRGIVARVESVARGIDVGGIVKIGTVRGMAESWANGRKAPELDPDAAPSDEWNPYNCDVERPAGTCFQRNVFGVSAAAPDGGPGYRCGPCGDEGALIDGMNRAFGANGMARFREPERDLARGAADGFTAAITKKTEERFADIVLNADLLETMVPMLEVIRYAPHNRPSDTSKEDGTTYHSMGTPPRARQVYQFAAVEVSSSYGIQCLLVFDEATNTCAGEKQEPGAIQVSLSDSEGKPLAGGAFEVRADVDADGVLGLKDTLLANGACVTAEDGVGTCKLDNLQPGSYLVSQVAAPAGYAKSAEPFVVELASGESRTVAFTNVSNVSTIDLKATDENGAPLSGASFAAYPDPDADGKMAPDAQPAATCTTDAQGMCSMQVPAGSYVLVQTSAPGGLEPIEPVAFTFASGGQTAAVGVVNYPADAGFDQPPPAAAPIYSAPAPSIPPTETVEVFSAPPAAIDAPRVDLPQAVGGTIVRVIRAPGDALRLFARDPRQAVAFTAALALLALALLAVRRRQLLGGLTAVPALAFTGGGTPPAAPPRGPAGPSGPSGGGSDGPAGPSGGVAPSHGGSGPVAGPTFMSATAVLDPPVVAGAAPPLEAGPVVAVAAVTAFAPLASVVRERLAADARCDLVAVVDSLDELRTLLAQSQPEVLIIDLALPTGISEDICDLLPGLHPPERTVGLILPRRSVDALITRGYKAGLGAMLDADEDLTNGQLGYAVRTVARGRVFYGPAVQSVMADRWASQPRRRDGVVAGLTERELEVAILAAGGMRRAEIAQRLFLSPDTVKGKLRVIRAKLGVTNPWDHDLLRRRLQEIGVADPEAPIEGGSGE